jgi:hypothetical protein
MVRPKPTKHYYELRFVSTVNMLSVIHLWLLVNDIFFILKVTCGGLVSDLIWYA